MYLEFVNRNISASLGYCNKSILLLGFRVLKHVIVWSTEEERTSLSTGKEATPGQASECVPACAAWEFGTVFSE